MAYPNKSGPGGCVVGLFGLLAWAYAGLCIYAIGKKYGSENATGAPEFPWDLAFHALVSFLVGLALLIVGWRLAIKVGGYDSWDPDEPRMKF